MNVKAIIEHQKEISYASNETLKEKCQTLLKKAFDDVIFPQLDKCNQLNKKVKEIYIKTRVTDELKRIIVVYGGYYPINLNLDRKYSDVFKNLQVLKDVFKSSKYAKFFKIEYITNSEDCIYFKIK